MATKKQRRRRSKDRRHEWEIVYVDDEGREVEVDEPEKAPARKSGHKSSTKAPARSAKRGQRKVDPPSWRRSARRALIFGPIAFVFFYLTMKTKSVPQAVYSAVIITAVLVPFTYLMDTLMYRTFRKRLERAGATQPKRR